MNTATETITGNLFDDLKTIQLDSWQGIENFFNENHRKWGKWICRGQRSCTWGLKTSFERVFEKRWKLDWSDAKRAEKQTLEEFQRSAHNYIQDPPRKDELMEWLALMQHFGGPTRLLDWSYSFYIAVFFAIEDAYLNPTGESCSVWLLDAAWWNIASFQKFNRTIEDKEQRRQLNNAGNLERWGVIFKNTEPFVAPQEPLKKNSRLYAQQGLFTVQADISKPLSAAMQDMYDIEKNAKDAIIKLDINVDPKQMYHYVNRLYSLNIHRSILFPDLGGLARKLNHIVLGTG